jgi:hypothetical protein
MTNTERKAGKEKPETDFKIFLAEVGWRHFLWIMVCIFSSVKTIVIGRESVGEKKLRRFRNCFLIISFNHGAARSKALFESHSQRDS